MKSSAIRVLLVDDDEDDYIVMKDLLSEVRTTRYQLVWASSAEQGNEKASRSTFDVYLVDYRLGGTTGLDLLKERVAQGDHTPVILLTGYGDHEVDQEAMRVGAADYLVKGELSPQLVERSIRYALYRTQVQAQTISQERMASIGLLASSLAHEIGTPLGVIRGRAEYLSMQVNDNPSVKNNVDVILAQIDRVSGLIRSLLNLARGDANENTSEVSVADAVKDVLDLTNHEFRKAGILVEHPFNENPSIRIRGSSEKLHQILLNLIVNSVYAIGEAKRNGRTENHKIGFGIEDLGAQWLLSITDTGCGISKENQSKLFLPFFTTKDIGVGTGLGLATCYWIVKSWGGAITVESQEGAGTTFRLQLPKV